MLTGVPEQSLLISPIPAGEEAFWYLVRQSHPRRVPRCRPMTSTFRGWVQRTVRSCRDRWPLSLGRRWATIIRTPSWPHCPTSSEGSSMLSMWRRAMRTPPARKENAPAEYCLGPQPGRPCGRERPAFRRADTQRARCKNSDATRSTIGVWLDALAMVFRLHHQGASGLAFAKQKKSHALEDTLLLLVHNVSEGQSHNPRSVALSIRISSQIKRPGLEPNTTSTPARAPATP